MIKTEASLNNKINILENEAINSSKLLKEVKENKDVLEKKYQEQEQELRELNESYELKLDIKERKINDLARNIEEELKNSAQINSEKESLVKDIARINQKLEKHKQEYLSVKEKFNNQEKEKEDLIATHNKMREELDKELLTLTENLNDIQVDKEKEFNLFRNEKANLESIIKSLKKDLEDYYNIKDESEGKQQLINQLNLDVADKTSRLNRSKEDLKDLTEQIENLKLSKKQEIERFDQEINSLIAENSNLKVNNSKKEIELEVTRQDIQNLKKIIENLKENNGSSEEENSKIEAYNKEVKLQVAYKDKIIQELESEIERLKSKLDRTKKTKDNEIQHLYKEIEKLNKKQLKSSHISTIAPSEKDDLIESLEDKNEELLDKIELLNQLKDDEAERFSIKTKETQETINKLNKEIASLDSKLQIAEKEIAYLNSRHKPAGNELRVNQIFINSLKKQNSEFGESIGNIDADEVRESITNLLEKENTGIIDEIEDLRDKAKNLGMTSRRGKEKDLTSIEELYKTTLHDKQIPELTVDEKINKSSEEVHTDWDNSGNNEEIQEEEFVKKLELYKDLINEEKEVTGKTPDNGNYLKTDNENSDFKTRITSEPIKNNGLLKKQTNINIELETASRTINEQLDKVERSLSNLHNKKTKAQKLDNTIYIFGGNKELEDNWKLDLEKCLQEYGLTHQWLLNSEKEIIRGPGKGIIFLISVGSLQYLENSELILRNSNIPAIKHPLTNITKLKLDIIDNFVRKR